MKKIILSVLVRELLHSKARKRRLGGKTMLWLVGLATAGTIVCALFVIWIAAAAIGHTVDFARTHVAIPHPGQLVPASLDGLAERPLIPPDCPEFLATLVQTPRLLTSPLRETWQEGQERCRTSGEPSSQGNG